MNKPREPISVQLTALVADTKELERQNDNLAHLVSEANDLLYKVEQAFEEMGIAEDEFWKDNSILLSLIRKYLYP
jgi:hypothetical protein